MMNESSFSRLSGQKKSSLLAVLSLLLLAACGGGGGGPSVTGGGGGSGSGFGGDRGPIGTPQARLTDAQIGALGQRSIEWTGTAPVEDGAFTVASVPMPYIELEDTNARAAWKQGWTGKGQTIAIIDDFSSAHQIHNGAKIAWSDVPVDFSDGRATEKASFYFERTVTHGELVAAIAGGEHSLVPPGSVLVQAPPALTCADTGCFTGDVTLSGTAPSFGVAKDAVITEVSVNLGNRQDPAATLNDILKAVEKHHDKAAINLSLSGPVPSGLSSFAAVAADFAARGHITSKSDAVIVVALGNNGRSCSENAMTGGNCNRIGVAFTHMEQLKDSTILAGALNSSGNGLAAYSNQPGDLQEWVLLAHDTASFSGLNQGEKQGTSFAAPRIAGAAAILRHNWPQLSGAAAAAILLKSANKDMDGDGEPDFSGSSPVYGQGKLDLMEALSPDEEEDPLN